MHPKTMMPMICVRRSQGFLASAMILLGWIGSAFADEAIVCPSEMSEVWELSTRHLLDRPRCIDTANPGFQVYRYADGIWRPDEVDRAIDMDGRL
ncbi:MAG: hypothetical protein ACK553_08905, partial [Planctomycetota bacterium]